MSNSRLVGLILKSAVAVSLGGGAYSLYLLMPRPAAPVIDMTKDAVSVRLTSSGDVNTQGFGQAMHQPDERILWKLFNSNKLYTLNKVIAQFSQQYPGWAPPAQLLSLLQIRKEYLENTQQGETSFVPTAEPISHDLNELMIQVLRQPNYDCSLLYLWNEQAVFHQLKNQQDRLKLFSIAIQHCHPEHSRFSLIQIAQNYLSVRYFNQLIAQAKRLLFSEQYLQKIVELQYRHNKHHLSRAVSANNFVQVEWQLKLLAPAIIRQRDVATANQLGWYFFNQEKLLLAISWFNRVQHWQPTHVESAIGLVYARKKNNQIEPAIIKAEQFSANVKMQVLLGELLLAKAKQLYEQGKYSGSQKLLQKARLYLAEQRLADELLAWIMYQTANSEKALQLAEPYQQMSVNMQELIRQVLLQRAWLLLEQRKYKQAEEVLQQAEVHLGRTTESNELRAWLRHHQRNLSTDYTELFFRKEFLAAKEQYSRGLNVVEQTKPKIGLLENINSAFVEAGILYRAKSGDAGTSRLSILSAPVFGGHYIFAHSHEVSFHVLRSDLSSGQLTDGCCVPIGSAGVGPSHISFTPYYNQLSNGFSFQLDYHKSGWLSPYFSIGSTPTGGALSPTVTWKAGFTHQRLRGFWGLEAFSRPIRESILSYTGMRDPYSGVNWGRVSSTGAQINGLYQFSHNWSVYTKFEGAFLHGINIADNMHLSQQLSVTYNLNLEYFDYFNIGPALALEHYSKNSNHFTLGHGGYFSPKIITRAGAEVNFLSEEGASFILKGRAGLGFQYYIEEQSLYFPGHPDLQERNNQVYLENSQTGLAIGAELKAAWLVHPNVQLAAGAGYRSINSYQDYFLGFNMRYYFKKRKASFSRDLPDFIFEQLF